VEPLDWAYKKFGFDLAGILSQRYRQVLESYRTLRKDSSSDWRS